MPSAKQRGSKGGHGAASPSDKGAHPSGSADDVAKKPPPAPQQQPQPPAPHPPPQQQHPQNPAHRGGHRGRSSAAAAAAAAASSSASCSRRLGRLLNFLFYLALVAAAAFSGWCVHHVLEEVQQVRRGHQDFSRQRDELGQSLQGVEQKVQSLQATFGTFESILRSSQHKQDLTEKAVKQGESEMNRISEVLQKLQNEILKDLSDGIHVVKDARERDFTSLENTVEERLTELTKSINDNIAIFTDVQKRSQKEINDVKMKVASLEESKGDRSQDLKILEKALKEVQASVKSRERDIEALQSSLQTMESDVYTEVRELVSLKQEQQAFKQAADSERLALEALTEKLLRSEETSSRLPEDIRRLEEELQQLKAEAHGPEEAIVFKDSKALDELQRQIEGLGARLQYVEDGVYSMQVASARHTESLESLLSKSQEYEQRQAMLQEHLESLGSSSDLASTVRSLGEVQLTLAGEVKELQQSVGELPGTVGSLQEQVHSMLGQDQARATGLPPQDFLDRLSSLDNLKSSVSQVESDLKMLRTAVDSLVAYSVKIETNENNLESAKGLLDDLRSDLDRLSVKVEKIHENI
ncbi:cytoskeleton-associated protein 4 [Peromyscus californicus insignis]|uniref:cytoskeleton-associated protein 4 n=1 Tax=Peromyscus californicus insignis TaxID=564181 RepID=UPI0022A7AA36|nr:cytoskeleton-associated protein 4 [Peromyscus californicus insignis]